VDECAGPGVGGDCFRGSSQGIGERIAAEK